jgi:hypothetical protein
VTNSKPPVQRFVARIKPRGDHPLYFEWQTAVACLFVGEPDRAMAQRMADAEIRQRGWQRMEFLDRSTLIEARVKREGGAVLDAYLRAQEGNVLYLEELDEIPFSTKHAPGHIAVPRLTESFIDAAILAAGGRRLDGRSSEANRPKTADYHLDTLVLELKDLQGEALEVRTRQEKLAALFASTRRTDGSSTIHPAVLSESHRREYFNIVGAPVQKALAAAHRQVRATLKRIHDECVGGGAILLNTGYGSMSHEDLIQIASSFQKRRTSLSALVCISAYTTTNGLDTVAHFMFYPTEGGHPAVQAFRQAFWKGIDEFMGSWARAGFQQAHATSPNLHPIVFEYADGVFTAEAPKAT